MKRIICGTDFSTHAEEAANVAAALAARHDGTVVLLHAVAPIEIELLDRGSIDAVRRGRRRALSAEAERLRGLGAHVREELVLGTPHEMLALSARRNHADLILVASLGEISARRWLAGSVASRTAQKSPVPTLVVRDYARLLEWAKGDRPLGVLACYNFGPESDGVLRWVAALREWGACDVTATYVSWPPEEVWRLGVSARTRDGGDNSAEVQALLEKNLLDRCRRWLGESGVDARVVSSWGRPDVHLNELAADGDADLIVVGTQPRPRLNPIRLSSVSRGVIRHSRTNVACVPSGYEAPRARDIAARRVLVPVDFHEDAREAVNIAIESAPEQAEVYLFHAVTKPPGSPEAAAAAQAAAARLNAWAGERPVGRRERSRVEVVAHCHPATAICQAAERLNADAIHIPSRGSNASRRTRRRSVAEAVRRRSCRPVRILHVQEAA